MRKVLILFFFCTFSLNRSQQFLDYKVAADPLIKHVEISPTLNNGLANQEVKLYDIELPHNMRIPISLNYFSRGNKVSDIASEVGLGWTLSVPYKVTRKVLGKADDTQLGLLNNKVYDGFFNSLSKRQEVASANANHDYDFIPDEFYFSLPGKNGKFILDWNDKKPVLQHFDDIKISYFPLHGSIREFMIIDKSGNEYRYGQNDLNYSNSINYKFKHNTYSLISEADNLEYFDSWYLREIKMNDNEVITFTYSENYKNFFSKYFDKETVTDSEEAGRYTYFGEIRNYDRKIESISWSQGMINFNYSTDREDLLAGFKLNDIVISNKKNIISKYKFSYEYSDKYDSASSTPIIYQFDTSSRKRLFLKSIQKQHGEQDKSELTRFFYNTETLPDRFSNSIDAWGYYNGKLNGNFLDDLHTVPNRNVDIVKSAAGILERIEYPSGLTTDFIYEHNDGFPSIADPSVINLGSSYKQESGGLTFYVNPGNPRTHNYDIADEFDGYFIKNFEIPENINRKENVKIEFVFNKFMVEGQEHNCLLYYAQVLDQQDNPVILFSRNSGSIITKDHKLIAYYDIPQAGKYKLRVDAMNCSGTARSFRIKLSWFQNSENRNILLGEGKRIKSITYKDDNRFIKNLQYKYVDNNNRSTGVIIGFPSYQTIFNDISQPGQMPFLILDPYGVRSGSPLSSYNLNSMAYSEVTEFIMNSDNRDNGKITYQFTNTPNGGGRYYRWPYHYPIDNEWLRGHIKKIQIYAKSENSYNIIKSIENNYKIGKLHNPELITDVGNFTISENTNFSYLKDRSRLLLPLARFYYDIEGHVNSKAPQPPLQNLVSIPIKSKRSQNLYYKPYYLTGGRFEKENSISTEYRNGSALVTTTEYYFENPEHFQTTTEQTLFADGSSTMQKIAYAHEKGNQKLIDANMVGIPLETEVKKNDVTVGKTEIKYDDPTHLFPTAQWAYDSAKKDLFEEVTYDRYDDNGNLLQYTTKAGVSTVIVWGYNKTQPIAKIEGAKLSDIPNSLITELQDASDYGRAGYLEHILITKLDNLRKSYPQFQITTYTYQPLVGVTSITPPSGMRELYEYDSAGRLKSVKDVEGRELKKYEYHYKTP